MRLKFFGKKAKFKTIMTEQPQSPEGSDSLAKNLEQANDRWSQQIAEFGLSIPNGIPSTLGPILRTANNHALKILKTK
jgi:hypothetical protein